MVLHLSLNPRILKKRPRKPRERFTGLLPRANEANLSLSWRKLQVRGSLITLGLVIAKLAIKPLSRRCYPAYRDVYISGQVDVIYIENIAYTVAHALRFRIFIRGQFSIC